MAAKNTKRKDKPLFRIRGALEVRAYRAKFRAYEATRYLNVGALRAKRKVTIEFGALEVAGKSYPVSVEIRNGSITSLIPSECTGCESKAHGRKKKIGSAALKKIMQAVDSELKERGLSTLRLPVPLKRVVSRRAINIPLGPIVITIGDLGDDGFDCCVTIYIPGFNICWCCVFNGCHCYAMP
jgi:hypothetical protein